MHHLQQCLFEKSHPVTCVKEKLERAKEGENHHVLDHEEEHWMKLSGIQIQHVSLKKQA